MSLDHSEFQNAGCQTTAAWSHAAVSKNSTYLIHDEMYEGQKFHIVNDSMNVIRENKFESTHYDPEDYVRREYFETVQIASAMAARGIITSDMPIVYPEFGGKLAAMAIQSITGGNVFPVPKNCLRKKEELPAETAAAINNASKIIICDDVIFNGFCMLKLILPEGILRPHIQGEIVVLANRINVNTVEPIRWRGGKHLFTYFPAQSEIYTGGLYRYNDRRKMSEALQKVTAGNDDTLQALLKVQPVNSEPTVPFKQAGTTPLYNSTLN